VESLLVIAVVGLAFALGAALVVMRRRADELDALLAAGRPARAPERAAGRPTADQAATDSHAATRTGPGDQALLDELPVGVLGVDADRRVRRANNRAHDLLGVAQGRLVGRTVMEAFLDARVEALVAGVPEGGSAVGEARLGAADARTIIVRVHRPHGDGTWVVLEDVSELRRLQQIRSEFIDNLGHELRTPLSNVSLLAESLARDAEAADVPPRMQDRIAKIEVETGHLVQMVNELLDLARIEGGSELHLRDEVSLGRLAAASVERLRLFAERQGVQLSVRTAPDVPPVRGDEERLAQVLVNLVHNAVKFSPSGGEVVVEVQPRGGEILTTVTDHGIGVAKADRTRIFERFYKADRARVRGGGTGLGLAIARHVVERHGGRIWVESEEGEGSAFTFAIPIAGGSGTPQADGPVTGAA
jgi:two-component system phosphate regulon sensor histidine kinase PhoR